MTEEEYAAILNTVSDAPMTVASIARVIVRDGVFTTRVGTNHGKLSRDWTRMRLMSLWRQGRVRIIERSRLAGGTLFLKQGKKERR